MKRLALLVVCCRRRGVRAPRRARSRSHPPRRRPRASATEAIVRGQYLAAVGDCYACHTVRGGPAYAGGLDIPTPFGKLYTPNITPDKETGIGTWTADDFWRAMHEGRSKDGSFLYPAFPYTNYTKVTREDSDAIYAYLMSLKPVNLKSKPHEMGFPYNQRELMAGWRALYFKPGRVQGEPEQVEGVESRRVPRRRARPLQRLPRDAQRARRDHEGRRLFGRPDPGAELVCAVAHVEPRDRARQLGHQGDRRPAAHRRLGARRGVRPDGRRRAAQPAGDVDGRPDRDGDVPEGAGRVHRARAVARD